MKIKKYNDFILNESLNRNEVIDFINDFGFFITLNLSKISTYSIDNNSKNELILMQKSLRQPIINGKTYSELLKEINIIVNTPKYLSSLLLQVKKFIEYIEPRIKKFVIDNEYKKVWLEKLEKFKTIYLKIIKD